ncbi:MAG TPA: DUF3999 family protein, partial [Acidobacteriaceae bacterium]
MKAAALLAVLLWQGAATDERPVAQPDHMQYERAINLGGAGQACAVLDAQIFPHAAPSLTDLRIFPTQGGVAVSGAHEVPYAITLSEVMSEETEQARVLNLGGGIGGGDSHGGKIVFDLEMPPRAYTGVTLDLDPEIHDFLATATVSGSDSLGSGNSTALGSFTLFDLSSQRLSRDTMLPLPESTFHYLHIVLSVSPAPGSLAGTSASFVPAMVRGAQVPPSREAQILYTAVAETSSIATVGRESRATFEIPPRVPVERVSFVPAPNFKGNFSRDVRVSGVTDPAPKGPDRDERAPLPEVVSGNILRVHTTEAGREIRSDQLSVPSILGANLQRPAKVEVAIENGDDQPLPIAAVRLEMRQRKLCFEAPAAGAELALYYGDPKLLAPVYDYERLFVVSNKAVAATLGPERLNADYHPPVEQRPFTERHPEVLWIALIAAICALGLV